MAKENEIVTWINQGILAALKDKRFAGAQLHGITTLLAKENESGTPAYAPCLIDNEGEGTWVGVDDAAPLQLYHRHNGCLFRTEVKEQFGTLAVRTEISAMSLFVVAQRKQVRLAPEDLKSVIADGFPYEITQALRAQLKIYKGNITLLSADLNAQNVYQKEYRAANTILDPQVNMFELKYQIECTYSRECINTLCC